jgi:hypothetical protein
MATSLDFLHFQHTGLEIFSGGCWKSRKPPFPHVHHSTPCGGPAYPGHGRPAQGRREQGERGEVVLVLQFGLRSPHVGFGYATIPLRWNG